MPRILELIDGLRGRTDLTLQQSADSCVVRIPKDNGYVCEIVIPTSVLEWFASVTTQADEREVWTDWMDYSGYDDSPYEKLEADMADDIEAFIERVTKEELRLPLEIWEEQRSSEDMVDKRRAQPGATDNPGDAQRLREDY